MGDPRDRDPPGRPPDVGVRTSPRRLTAEEIQARTPPGRNRYADFLRFASILVVVLGHWLISVVTVTDGQLEGESLLALVPETQWLTWVFQVMPLFFWVGGYANAAAYRSARTRGIGWADWVRGRARRLLRPAVPLFAVWIPVGVVLGWFGVPRDMLQFATQVVIVPVWFLAAYLVVCSFVPVTYRLHEAAPVATLLTFVSLAVGVDVLHQLGTPVIGWSNFLWVWGAIHQAGYLWHDEDRGRELAIPPRPRLPRRWVTSLGLAACGYAVLVVLTGPGEYPLSMVGVGDGSRSNNSPPSIALLALACGQIGLALSVRGPARRLLDRPRVWGTVVVAGSFTMTVYLWHMTAMVAVAAALVPTGVWSRTQVIDAGWWALRPVWLLLCAVVTVALTPVFGRFEHAGAPRSVPSAWRAGVGVALATAGIGLLVFGGLHRPGTFTGVPWVPLGLTVVGLGALGVLRAPARPEALPPPGGAAEPAEITPPESPDAASPRA